MEILNKKDYPGTFTYVGPAQKGYVNFWTFKVGLLSDNTVIKAINWAVEKVLHGYGLEPIYINIYRWESTHYWLPTYDYRVEFVYYEKELSLGKGEEVKKELVFPAVIIWAIAAAILTIGIGVAARVYKYGIFSIFWGAGEEVSTWEKIMFTLIGLGVVAGGGYLFYKKVIKKRGGKS